MVAYDAVPNNELVILVILKLPVEIIEPLVNSEPVKVKVSALAENTVVPVAPTNVVEPVTIKLPVITALPVNGKGETYPDK